MSTETQKRKKKLVILLKLKESFEQANSIDTGRVLHSKAVTIGIIEHVSLQIKKKKLNHNYGEQQLDKCSST